MMPAGARARSFSRPFGLNFAFAPRSACFKGQEKQTPPFIAEGRRGVARPKGRKNQDFAAPVVAVTILSKYRNKL